MAEEDHSDMDDLNDEDEFPLVEEDMTDSDEDWPVDSSGTDVDDDEQPDESQSADREPDNSSFSYTYLILIGGAIFLAMLPIWFHSPNGFSLIKETFQGNDNNNKPTAAASCNSVLRENERIFTKRELAKYTKKPKILLGFLGVVYDVTNGQYYHPDGSYHFFAGIDGTRGFLTGEFTPEELIDDISDLDPSYLSGIDTWLNLYKEKYERVGLLVGAYYDSKGCETDILHHVNLLIEQSKVNAADDRAETERYPPCNSEWNATEKRGRVWCSKLSGGINRSWAGHPRQYYVLSSKNWRCACIENDNEVSDWCDPSSTEDGRTNNKKSAGVKYAKGEVGNSTPDCLFKHYPNCDPQATECPFQD